MMDNNKVNKVKKFFNELLTPEQKEAFKQEFGEMPIAPVAQAADPATEAPATTSGTAKLKDGTVIEYDKLAEGGVVLVVAADGNKLPAPIGDWELEDGTIITISEGGIITSVKAPSTTEEAPTATTQSVDPTSKLVEALKGIMNAKFAEQAKEIESLKAENIALKAEFAKQVNAVNTVSEFFNAITNVPTKSEPTQINKSSKKQNPLTYL